MAADDGTEATDAVGSAELTIGDAGAALDSRRDDDFGNATRQASDGEDGQSKSTRLTTVPEASLFKPGTRNGENSLTTTPLSHGGKICLFVTAVQIALAATDRNGNGGESDDEIVISAPTGAIHGYTDGAADHWRRLPWASNSQLLPLTTNQRTTKYFTVTRTLARVTGDSFGARYVGTLRFTAGFADGNPQLVLSFELTTLGQANDSIVADADCRRLHYSETLRMPLEPGDDRVMKVKDQLRY